MSTATATATTAADEPKALAHWVVPLAVLIAGMFMSVLDTSIVNVAVSTIQTELGGSTEDVQWISTAYSLVLGVVVPASAWLGNRFGLARVYTIALAAFALGSALCGFAWSLNSLIAFRVIQAIPGGLLPAVTLTMVYMIVPRQKIGAAMGMYGLGIIFAPAIGPALGGYLVEYISWRLVFYINVPIGIAGVIAAVMLLPKFPPHPTQKFDVWGFVTVATGLVALLLAFRGQLLGLDQLPGADLDHRRGGLPGAVRDHRARGRPPVAGPEGVRSPHVHDVADRDGDHDDGALRHLFYVPLFLQSALGYPALDAGLLILPQALVMGFLTPIAGRLYDRIGPRWLVFTGLLIAAYGSYLLSGISLDVTRGEIVLWMCIRSAGVGLSMMAVMTGDSPRCRTA